MPQAFCHHQIGTVLVLHRRGAVLAGCAVCPAVLSEWCREGESEAVELRGVMGEVKHHLHARHGDLDLDVADSEALRACAWHSVIDADHLGERVPARA